MKKILIIIAIAFFGFTTVKAQDVDFGIKGGVNFTTITGTDYEGLRVSFHVGFATEIAISDNFSIQPELLFSSQGSEYDEIWEGGSFFEEEKVDIKVNYLNIPVMAKFYPVGGFNIEVGPQIGFLLSADTDWTYNEDGNISSGSEDIKDHLKGIDLGLNLGLGYKFENGLNVGARYTLDLTDINDSKDIEFIDSSSKFKNIVGQVFIGYFF